MKENIDHWLDLFENFNTKYTIMPIGSYNYSFTERVEISQLDHHQVSLIKKITQDGISMQQSNCYITIFFSDN